jgi:hypothetical protein
MPTTAAVAGVAAEYLVNAFVTAALTIAGLSWLRRAVPLASALDVAAGISIIAMGTFLTAAGLAIGFRLYLLGTLVAAAGHVPIVGRRLHVDRGAMRAVEDRLFLVLRARPARFLVVLLLEIVAHAILLAEVWWIMQVLHPSIGITSALAAEAAAKISGIAFFFVPSQVGAAEGVYAAVFNALGLGSASGFALAIVRRVRTLAVSAIGAVVLYRRVRK